MDCITQKCTRCICNVIHGQRTDVYRYDPLSEQRLSHTALLWRLLAHRAELGHFFNFTSLSDWVAASRALPLLLPPLPALGLVMPRPCHKDSTFRWEKLRKCIEKLKKANWLSLKVNNFFLWFVAVGALFKRVKKQEIENGNHFWQKILT